MTIHVVAHPQTDTTKAYGMCGFAQKTRRFCWMMKSLGHSVFLYGGTDNDAPCDEFVPLVDKKEQVAVRDGKHYIHPSWDPAHWVWKAFNKRAAMEILKRGERGDPVCVLGGNIFFDLQERLPGWPVIEYGIGYFGYGLKHKIWESNAWKTLMLQSDRPDKPEPDDPVIHGFFDEDEFTIAPSEGYLLYVGRIVAHKGIEYACEAAKRAGRRLLVVGHGDKKLIGHGAEYLGEVSSAERNRLMAGADALLCPTRRFEAFGNIVPEAGMCGTRVISGVNGGFTETVIEGVTGWRGGTPDELVKCISKIGLLADKDTIRKLAIERFSVRAQRHKYQAYFDALKGKGMQ